MGSAAPAKAGCETTSPTFSSPTQISRGVRNPARNWLPVLAAMVPPSDVAGACMPIRTARRSRAFRGRARASGRRPETTQLQLERVAQSSRIQVWGAPAQPYLHGLEVDGEEIAHQERRGNVRLELAAALRIVDEADQPRQTIAHEGPVAGSAWG